MEAYTRVGAVDGEKYSDSSHILKGQTIGFPSSLQVDCEQKRRIRADTQVSGPSNGKDKFPWSEMRKTTGDVGVGRKSGAVYEISI